MSENKSLPEVLKARPQNRFLTLFLKSAFLVLGFIAVTVAVSWSFGWIAVERLDSTELFNQSTSGRKEIRALAAMDWVKRLQQHSESGQETAFYKLAPTAAEAESLLWELENFRNVRELNAPLVTAIASLVGFAPRSTRIVEGLKNFLTELKSDELLEARIAAMLSLVRLNAYEHVSLFLEQSTNPDASVRKAVAFALGEFGTKAPSEELLQTLKNLLADSVDDVRWNAAFALARLKDSSGLAVLKGLFDRMEATKELTAGELQIYQEAFRAAVTLKDAELLQRLERISNEHANLKLRQLAKEWVAKK